MHTLPTCRCRCLGMPRCATSSELHVPRLVVYPIFSLSVLNLWYIILYDTIHTYLTQHRLQLHYHQYLSFYIFSLTHAMSSVILHIR